MANGRLRILLMGMMSTCLNRQSLSTFGEMLPKDEVSCPFQGETGSCHGDGLKIRGIYLNPSIKGGVKRRDLRKFCFLCGSHFNHSIAIYAKTGERVAFFAFFWGEKTDLLENRDYLPLCWSRERRFQDQQRWVRRTAGLQKLCMSNILKEMEIKKNRFLNSLVSLL